jgi:hypothetical protein
MRCRVEMESIKRARAGDGADATARARSLLARSQTMTETTELHSTQQRPLLSERGTKRLAVELSGKWQKPCSQVCGCVQARLSVAAAHAAHSRLRGSRAPASKISTRLPQWEDGAGSAAHEWNQRSNHHLPRQCSNRDDSNSKAQRQRSNCQRSASPRTPHQTRRTGIHFSTPSRCTRRSGNFPHQIKRTFPFKKIQAQACFFKSLHFSAAACKLIMKILTMSCHLLNHLLCLLQSCLQMQPT